MKRLLNAEEQPSLLDTPQSGKNRLLGAGGFSLLLHSIIIIFLIFYLKAGGPNGGGGGSSVYRVTIRSLSSQGDPNPSSVRELHKSQVIFSKKQIKTTERVSIEKIDQQAPSDQKLSSRDEAELGREGSGSGVGQGGGNGDGSEFLGLRGFGRSGVSSPRYIENPKPEYPPDARQEGYEGKVLLKVEVLPNGRVGTIEVEKSSGYAVLDRSALTGVKKWKFIPAKKGRVAIRCSVNILITFQLRDSRF
jgi:TonB family protein